MLPASPGSRPGGGGVDGRPSTCACCSRAEPPLPVAALLAARSRTSRRMKSTSTPAHLLRRHSHRSRSSNLRRGSSAGCPSPSPMNLYVSMALRARLSLCCAQLSRSRVLTGDSNSPLRGLATGDEYWKGEHEACPSAPQAAPLQSAAPRDTPKLAPPQPTAAAAAAAAAAGLAPPQLKVLQLAQSASQGFRHACASRRLTPQMGCTGTAMAAGCRPWPWP
mmetsp:Transcript_4174/g.9579  ORF Transcript_4174/g.9579 Transcript_4174/m.9579 type:complete len:221 (+) Transcript_4174:257-919(+)